LDKVFINIKELLQVRDLSETHVSGNEMNHLPKINNAFLRIKDERIIEYGKMEDFDSKNDEHLIDVSEQLILPTWCDSHTHTVFTGDRSQEFVDRIKGLSYQDIAKRGGGILNSAALLQNTDESTLFNEAWQRINELMKLGTGALEIKSGYGLTTKSELKMLKIIRSLDNQCPIKIKATFLGAHAVPKAFQSSTSKYVDLIIDEMLPKIQEQNLADFIDVFCEKNYFSNEDTKRVLEAGARYGLVPKIHVNQFNTFGGVKLAVDHNALSVDHLEQLSTEDLKALSQSSTMAVALPSCSFFLGIPYTPARKLIDSGLPLALASDYNPGSSPSGNMNFVVSLACIKMKMTPEEAINAATINGAYAMQVNNDYGSITVGKKANIIITKPLNSYRQIPYNFGRHSIDKVMINGEFI
jgi:imidazolonepropionase